MAFLVEQPPGSVVQTHFHVANQFQIVVAGSGKLGGHAVEPVAVHYSNAYSAYGPIAAGPEGLQYFTLRNGYDPGARYLPAARRGDPWRPTPVPRCLRRAGTPVTAAPEASTTDPLLAVAPDGMGAWRHRMPPGSRLEGADPATGDGQFWVVTAGSLEFAGRGGAAAALLRLRRSG